jgi:hypothetical protein
MDGYTSRSFSTDAAVLPMGTAGLEPATSRV